MIVHVVRMLYVQHQYTLWRHAGGRLDDRLGRGENVA